MSVCQLQFVEMVPKCVFITKICRQDTDGIGKTVISAITCLAKRWRMFWTGFSGGIFWIQAKL